MNGENAGNNAFATKKKKRMSVERIYQKKTQLEHILLRPDTYVGSVEPIKQSMWVYDEQLSAIVSKEITYVPGLYKIFDELLGKWPINSYHSLNEAEYHLKNYGDLRWCYPPRP